MDKDETVKLRKALQEILLCAKIAKADTRRMVWSGALGTIIEIGSEALSKVEKEQENKS